MKKWLDEELIFSPLFAKYSLLEYTLEKECRFGSESGNESESV